MDNQLSVINKQDISLINETVKPLPYYGLGKNVFVEYVSDIHILHHVKYFGNDLRKTVRMIARSLYDSSNTSIYTKGMIVFCGDIATDPNVVVELFRQFVLRYELREIKRRQQYFKQVQLLRDERLLKNKKEKFENINKILNQYPDEYETIAKFETEREVKEYLTLHCFDYGTPSFIRYKFFDLWKLKREIKKIEEKVFFLKNIYGVDSLNDIKFALQGYEIKREYVPPIIFILGNHEYVYFEDVDTAYKFYYNSLIKYNITVLQNMYIEQDDLILYGGTGFAKYNQQWNACNLISCKKMMGNRDYECEQTKRFEDGYLAALSISKQKKKCLLCFSHYPIEDCLNRCDHEAIYFYGHNHHNSLVKTEKIAIYADNQIGYHKHGNFKQDSIVFKYMYTGIIPNPLFSYNDGCHEIEPEVYFQFMHFLGEPYGEGKLIKKRCDNGDKLYAIIKSGYYGFFVQGKNGILIVSGGKLKKITDAINIKYIEDNFIHIVQKYVDGLAPIRAAQEVISKQLESMGFYGTIHGLIVDIDYYHHIMINPSNGELIFYFSPTFGIVKPFSSFKQLVSNIKNTYGLTSQQTKVLEGNKSNTPGESSLMNIETNNMLSQHAGGTSDFGLVNVSRTTGAYGASRKMAALQKLFTGHLLKDIDLSLAVIEDENRKKRKKSYIGTMFKTEDRTCYIVIDDDLMDKLTVINTSTNIESTIAAQVLKSKIKNGNAWWVTHNQKETEEMYPTHAKRYLLGQNTVSYAGCGRQSYAGLFYKDKKDNLLYYVSSDSYQRSYAVCLETNKRIAITNKKFNEMLSSNQMEWQEIAKQDIEQMYPKFYKEYFYREY